MDERVVLAAGGESTIGATRSSCSTYSRYFARVLGRKTSWKANKTMAYAPVQARRPRFNACEAARRAYSTRLHGSRLMRGWRCAVLRRSAWRVHVDQAEATTPPSRSCS
jgi:hypothetical protein